MKVTTEELDYIQTVIKVANMIDVQAVIIEPDKVRAMNESQTIFMFQDKGVPKLCFGSIGLNRMDIFTPRLTLAKSFDNFVVDATTVGEDNEIGFDKFVAGGDNRPPMWARSLTMTGKGAKLEYRCASPQTIRAPKNRAGIAQYKFNLTAEALDMIQKGKAAMKSKEFTFVGDDEGVTLEIADINGDTLQYKITDTISGDSGGSPIDFSYTYPIDSVLPVLKLNPTGAVQLTTKGSLIVTINELDVYFVTMG